MEISYLPKMILPFIKPRGLNDRHYAKSHHLQPSTFTSSSLQPLFYSLHTLCYPYITVGKDFSESLDRKREGR